VAQFGRAGWLVRLRTDGCDLSRSQPWQERENLGHQGQSLIQLGAASHKHRHRDLKFGGVLMKTQVAVCRQENMEFSWASASSFPFLLPPQPIFCTETQSCPVNARPKRQSRHSSMRMHMADGFEHFQLAGFNDGDGLRAFDRRKSLQKTFNGFAAFQGINQILQGDTRADKNGGTNPFIQCLLYGVKWVEYCYSSDGTERKEFAMRMPITRIVMIGLLLITAKFNQRDSLGADATAQTNAKPERLIDIKVALSVLTAYADCQIQGMASSLSVVAEAQEIQSLDWARMKPLLAAVQERFGPAAVWFARPDGSYFSVDKGLTDQNLKNRPYFAKVMAGELSIGELVVSRSTGADTVITAVPVKRDGKVVGVLGASIYLDKLAQQIKKTTPLPEGVVFYALDPKGQIALHSQEGLIFQEATQLGSPTLTEAIRRMLASRDGVVTYEFEGRQQKAIFQTSSLTGWKFVIRFPAEK